MCLSQVMSDGQRRKTHDQVSTKGAAALVFGETGMDFADALHLGKSTHCLRQQARQSRQGCWPRRRAGGVTAMAASERSADPMVETAVAQAGD
jgi:hypothetical protein